jgi:hypothetical protein
LPLVFKTTIYWYWLKLNAEVVSKMTAIYPGGAPPGPKPSGFGVT